MNAMVEGLAAWNRGAGRGFVRIPVLCVAACLLVSPGLATVAAQSSPAPPETNAAQVAAADNGQPEAEPSPSFARAIGRDFRALFSLDAARTLGVFALGGLAAHPLDADAAEADRERLQSFFSAGATTGSPLVQVGGGLGTYVVGRVTGHEPVVALGRDLLRSQILSQGVTQAAKFATHRQRPDGSNHRSLPSGHAASAFATAGVLQKHLGWRVGVPGYFLAGYVSASRVTDHKHYLSDVIVGAGVGLASAQIVTISIGGRDVDVGVTPVAEGTAVTFRLVAGG